MINFFGVPKQRHAAPARARSFAVARPLIQFFRRKSCIALILLISTPGWVHAKSRTLVGFQTTTFPNGSEPPLRVAIWYPTQTKARLVRLETFTQFVAPNGAVSGRDLPLVLISHGGGGTYASHYDTALALARSGFVVAAVDHAGDTYGDETQVLKLWRRPQQVSQLITFMLTEWRDRSRIDPQRVGAFGFSNGGFTLLVSAGGKPDLRLIDPYCRNHPDHDLCTALRRAGVKAVSLYPVPPDAWSADNRLKAIAVAAPAFGFTFADGGLGSVHIPVQLWRAIDDRHQPNPWYDEAVRNALPRRPELHEVAGAGHYDLLAPCSATLAKAAPEICDHPGSFDRAVFHFQLNRQLVGFFMENLR